MALKLVKKVKPIAPTPKYDFPVLHINVRVPVTATQDPTYNIETAGVPCTLNLAWNNSERWSLYSVRCEGTFIGYIRTAGGECVSCKAEVPSRYDLNDEKSSHIRMAVTAASMKDACFLLLKHAGVWPNTPAAAPKVNLNLTKYLPIP